MAAFSPGLNDAPSSSGSSYPLDQSERRWSQHAIVDPKVEGAMLTIITGFIMPIPPIPPIPPCSVVSYIAAVRGVREDVVE